MNTKFGIGAFSPVPAVFGFFFVRWSKCHGHDLYEQCMRGVRYIDLRICRSHIDSELRTEHTVYGEKISMLLGQIKRFLDEQPNELLVLYTHKFRSGFSTLEDHHAFLDLVKSVFPDHPTWFTPKSEFHLPFTDLKKRGRR